MANHKRPKTCEITPESTFLNRRKFIFGIVAAAGSSAARANPSCHDSIDFAKPKKVTELKHVKSYNNYYEFSTDKKAVAILAQALTLEPWTLTVQGLVEKPLTLDIQALIKLCQTERIYRFRCVEGWSMVVPWLGIPLKDVLKLVKPLSKARFVKFISAHRPKEMIGQRMNYLDWPYTEALRIDEAAHPLSLLATGYYGQSLEPQNGAPLRLIVPWKYGYKSGKAITHIELVSEQPATSWMKASPKEYGFYANVNPNVAHPRWSQRRETPLGETHKVRTLMYNGYEQQVEHLYKNMDLEQHY